MTNVSPLSPGDNVSIKIISPSFLIHFGMVSPEMETMIFAILERANMEKKDIDRIITLYSSFTVLVECHDMNLRDDSWNATGIMDSFMMELSLFDQ